ncbi:MAG: anaerobic ribonucleoside-triphosphate reductase activating protein [Mycoplasmatales bacterium]
MERLKVNGFAYDSIVDGPGQRFTIFTQGCPHDSQGCHNQQTWTLDKNKEYTEYEKIALIKEESFTKNVTFSGGETYLQVDFLLSLGTKLKEEGYNIWCYTGFIYEDILINEHQKKLLSVIDILFDWPFVEELKDHSIEWRGSSNQRIIDLKDVTL